MSNPTADELYSRYHDRILSYTRRRLDSLDDAEDVTASVFVSAIAALDTYDASRAEVSTWLYTITNNAIRDQLRRRQTANRHMLAADDEFLNALPDEREPFTERLLREELLEQLAVALETLPKRERDIILLFYYDELPQKDIALRLGLSYANVRLLCHKGVERLRAQLHADGLLCK